MKDVRLTLKFDEFRDLVFWAQDHAQDGPEAAMLWRILQAKVDALARREDYSKQFITSSRSDV